MVVLLCERVGVRVYVIQLLIARSQLPGFHPHVEEKTGPQVHQKIGGPATMAEMKGRRSKLETVAEWDLKVPLELRFVFCSFGLTEETELIHLKGCFTAETMADAWI